ncbi:MAG: response regulator transcription factor [Moheibacter sp.]
MKVIIVEDELLIAEQLEDVLTANDCTVIGVAENLEKASNLLKLKPDFVFLDIQLKNNENGIDFGNTLNQKGIPFIYITANTEVETLKEAVQTNPISYISKPFKSNDVIAALELIRLKHQMKPKITLKLANKDVDVFLDDILFCEAKGSYTEIVTKQKRYTKRINLKDFLKQLDSNFVRVHRSFAVNKNQITYKTSTSIFFHDQEIPVSKLYRDSL